MNIFKTIWNNLDIYYDLFLCVHFLRILMNKIKFILNYKKMSLYFENYLRFCVILTKKYKIKQLFYFFVKYFIIILISRNLIIFLDISQYFTNSDKYLKYLTTLSNNLKIHYIIWNNYKVCIKFSACSFHTDSGLALMGKWKEF